jgi:glutamyl-tRNA synthetase
LLNYLVRLGWSHGDQEIFTRKQMIELFDIKDINRSAATFNPDKLLWLNQHYIKESALEDLIPQLNWHLKRQGVSLEQGPSPERLLEAQRERARTLVELVTNSRFFYAEPGVYDEQAATKHLTSEAADVLDSLVIALRAVHEWRAPAIHEALAQVCADKGLKLGKVAQPLRVAVSGGAVSPPIDITLELLGKARTLARVRTAIDYVRTKLHST